jgi:hypothetical protein
MLQAASDFLLAMLAVAVARTVSVTIWWLDSLPHLVTRETTRVTGDEYSSDLASGLINMLTGWHIDDASLYLELDDIWGHRQTSMGPIPLRWD